MAEFLNQVYQALLVSAMEATQEANQNAMVPVVCLDLASLFCCVSVLPHTKRIHTKGNSQMAQLPRRLSSVVT
jgi:hypothetical protein